MRPWIVFAAACGVLSTLARADIANTRTTVRPVKAGAAFVGFDVLARTATGATPVAEVRWSSGARWTAARCSAAKDTLRFGGFATPGTGTPTLSAGTHVTVRLAGDDPYPRVSFRFDLTAFDEGRWRKAWTNLPPVYFLRCSLPGTSDEKQVFYQHGILYPGPQENPYPITMGPMRGDWCPRWSYAPAVGAAPIPAMGLWSPVSRLFAAYEFQEARTTDRSDKHVASSYCAGLPDHPGQFFCLSTPYAGDWLRLKLPRAPTVAGTRFRIVYSTDMPSDADPNRFVIRHLLATYRSSLPPSPGMNDMSWLRQGKEATQIRFLHALGLAQDYPRRNVQAILYRPYEQCEKPFFDPGAVQLVAHQTGKTARYMVEVGDREGLAALRAQVEYLLSRATTERFGADVCTVWNHPLEGQFKEMFGGARATGTRHMFNWGIASAMLWLHKASPEPRYLPVLDGMVAWSRHYLYDLAGMADLPWAVFSMGGANGGEFLLDYYYTFRDDPARRELALEARRLAETIVWRNSYWYTGDPIETDAKDPSFLLQAVNSSYWLGKVTWGEMGRVPEMAIRMYVETGDLFWKHLVRGCLEQFHMGTRNSDGEYVENLDVFGDAGTSGGWGGNNFRWLAEPLGTAVMQVDVGPKAAIAFCRGTTACDIADYRMAPDGGFGFTVKVNRSLPHAPDGPFDIMVTSPHASLTGIRAFVGGSPIADERVTMDAAGLHAMVRGIRAGDRITFGVADVAAGTAARDPMPVRSAWSPAPSRDFAFADLRPVARAQVDNTWQGPWASYRPGPMVASGAAFCLIDPAANGGLGAVAIMNGATVRPATASTRVLVVLGAPNEPKGPLARVVVQLADGARKNYTLRAEDGAEVMRANEWYEKTWWVRAFVAGSDTGAVRSVRITSAEPGSGVVLLALTSARSARGAAALASMARDVELRNGLDAYQRTQAPTAHAPVNPAWHVPSMRRRFLVKLAPTGAPRSNALVRLREDLGSLFAQVGEDAPSGAIAVRAFVLGSKVDSPVREAMAQFCPDQTDSLRGELLVRVPGVWSKPIWVAVYIGAPPQKWSSGPKVAAYREGSAVQVTGPMSRVTFDLGGAGTGPRMTTLSFAGGPNLLRKAGWDEGFGHLCACQDGKTWYDFGALQTRDATVRFEPGGPVAQTMHIDGLELYGEGSGIAFEGVGTAGGRGAEVKGVASWHLRMYHDVPAVDSWVTYRITDPGTGWTRPLEARFGVAGATGVTVGDPGKAGALAAQDGLALVALDDWKDRPNVTPRFTAEDGSVLSVLLNTADSAGVHASDRWRMLPAGRPEEALRAEAEFASAKQFALEARGAARAPVKPMSASDDAAAEAGWEAIVPAWAATFEAGRPDRENGLRSKDNPDEGTSVRETKGDSVVVAPGADGFGRKQSFFYWDVAEDRAAKLRGGRAVIAIEYLDAGRGTASIHYDSTDEAVRQSAVPGAFKEASRQVVCGNTGTWKVLVISVPDARFSDGCNGSDFRVSTNSSTVYIRRVAVWGPGGR